MPAIIGILNNSIDATVEALKRDKIRVLQKTFSQTYIIIADDIDDTEVEILATPGLPQIYSPLRGAFATSANAVEQTRLIRHPVTSLVTSLWHAMINFDSNVDPEEENVVAEARVPIVRWTGEQEDKVITKEAGEDGKDIVTTAGEQLLITSPNVVPILEVQRYEVWPFSPLTMLAFANRTNSTPFYGAPIGTALMMPMDVEQQLEDGRKLNLVTYRIKFRVLPPIEIDGVLEIQEDTWDVELLNHGQLFREAIGEDAIVHVDKNGRPTTVNLDLNGLILPEAADAVYLKFKIFERVNLNALSLGPFA